MLAKVRPFAPALLVVAAMGCFTYRDTPTGDPPPAGREVKLTLSGEGRAVLSKQLGPSVARVYGRLVSSDSSNVTVALTRTELADGTDAPWNGEQVTIAKGYIRESQERKVEPVKTVGLMALVAGAVTGIAVAFGHGSSGSGSSVPGSGAK